MLLALYLNGASVHHNGISGNGKSKPGSADFPGMKLIHPIKTFKNPVYGFLFGIPMPESATDT